MTFTRNVNRANSVMKDKSTTKAGESIVNFKDHVEPSKPGKPRELTNQFNELGLMAKLKKNL